MECQIGLLYTLILGTTGNEWLHYLPILSYNSKHPQVASTYET